MCDSDQVGPKTSEETIQTILPPILDKGLGSSVSEVRAVALNLVVKITKSAGSRLKSHIPQLVPALLEATSELESKEVSYLSNRLANDESIQEKLDLARISAAKSSPMMECVNHVLQFVDGDILILLIPKLIDLIKSSIGLSTKGITNIPNINDVAQIFKLIRGIFIFQKSASNEGHIQLGN